MELNEEEGKSRKKWLYLASGIALGGNALLAALKISFGFLSGSMAVVGDGIDSAVDTLISVMTLMVARVSTRPADDDHPWGHGRAETLATAILGGLLFFAGAQLIMNSITNLVNGTALELPSRAALIATGVSIAGKLLLAYSQWFFGKKASSPMLKANARNMASDVLLSVGVLAGLAVTLLFKVKEADAVMAVVVGLWVIKQAMSIILDVKTELMDETPDQESYRALFEAVRSVEGAGNPHRTRMRKVAGLWDIDVDIEVEPNLTVLEAHCIAWKVEDAIKRKLDNVYDIMVHIEPEGNVESESFGLSDKK
jgi:cation diffusion facilitator family transporter